MFNKNKKKTDSKIRFQNPRFRKQLQSAREYKRSPRQLPKTPSGVFLAKIGLGSWISRSITGLVFLLVIYVVFIPNFFFVKQTTVNDSDASGKPGVQNLVQSFINKDIPWPQKNLLLTSKSKLKNFLLQNDKQVLSVDSITKKLPSTLIVSVTPRIDEFEVLTASSTVFSVSNDGLVTGELLPNASGTLPTLSYLIKLTDVGNLDLGQSAFNNDKINFIESLGSKLPAVVKSQVGYYEISDLVSPYLNVYMSGGLELKFDSTSDINQSLDRLNLLLSQLSPGAIKTLYYVDMRFEGRGYVCYQKTPCANNAPIPNVPATTTPDSSITN